MDYRRNYLKAVNEMRSRRESTGRAVSAPRATKGLGAKVDVTPLQSEGGYGANSYMENVTNALRSISAEITTSPTSPETVVETSPRPQTPLEGLSDDAELTKDPEFMAAVKRLEEKFPGLERRELFRVIKGESKFDPKATNKYNMAGLLQISPESAKRLGTTKQEILEMSPAEQIDLYAKYLDMWNYTSDKPLAMMQAAPSKAGGELDDVVYAKGSKAWEANPGWRPEDGGDITMRSIKAYYGG